MSLFGTTQTPLTDAIEQATSPQAAADDIALHLSICDMINESDAGPRDAARVLRKKLSPKSPPAVIVKAIAVLEVAAKNCGKRFHIHVTSKDFVAALNKLLEQKGQSAIVREKVLGLIQTWADAFRSDPTMVAISRLHQDLLLNNVEFPAQNLDEMAPMFTPEMSIERQADTDYTQAVAPQAAAAASGDGAPPLERTLSQSEQDALYARQLAQQFEAEAAAAAGARGQQQPQAQQQTASSGPAPGPGYTLQTRPMHLEPGQRVNVDPEQLEKIRYDLKIVQNNVTMLTDMLSALGPDERVKDADVIGELQQACSQMRTRVLTLIEGVSNDDLLGELLAANDQLTDVLVKYDEAVARHSPSSTHFSPDAPVATSEGSLIDLGGSGDSAPTAAMADMQVSEPELDPLRQHDGPSLRDSLQSSTRYERPDESLSSPGLRSALPSEKRRGAPPPTSMEEPDEMESSTLSPEVPTQAWSPPTSGPATDDLIQLDDAPSVISPRATLGMLPTGTVSDAHRQRLDTAEEDHFGL